MELYSLWYIFTGLKKSKTKKQKTKTQQQQQQKDTQYVDL